MVSAQEQGRLGPTVAGPVSSVESTVSPGPRAERRIVREYLEALEATRHRDDSARQLQAHLVLLDSLVGHAGPDERVALLARRLELRSAATRCDGGCETQALAHAEAAFITVARAYSEREGISYAAWRGAGVEARVLRAAGVGGDRPPPRDSHPPGDTPCPKPVLRCWLLLLIAESPRHGYELGEALVAAGAGVVDTSRVYRVLHTLEMDALVSSAWQASTRPAPACRVYSITTAGHDALDVCAGGLADLRRSLRGLRP